MTDSMADEDEKNQHGVIILHNRFGLQTVL